MNECHQESSKKKLKTCDKPEEYEGYDKTDPWDRQPYLSDDLGFNFNESEDSDDDSNQCNQIVLNI